MKKWNEMSGIEKTKTMLGIFVYIVGVATLYYATLIAAVTWICAHTDSIKRLAGSIKNLVQAIARRVKMSACDDDAFKELIERIPENVDR